METFPSAPARIVLDLDGAYLPLHGQHEDRFFRGYYAGYSYLPLDILCCEHLRCARLRPSNRDAAAGSVEEVERNVNQIRKAWPAVQVIRRGDSGFCRNRLMSWCEADKVAFVFGFARNPPSEKLLLPCMDLAQAQKTATRKPGLSLTSTIRRKEDRGASRAG